MNEGKIARSAGGQAGGRSAKATREASRAPGGKYVRASIRSDRRPTHRGHVSRTNQIGGPLWASCPACGKEIMDTQRIGAVTPVRDGIWIVAGRITAEPVARVTLPGKFSEDVSLNYKLDQGFLIRVEGEVVGQAIYSCLHQQYFFIPDYGKFFALDFEKQIVELLEKKTKALAIR